MNDRIVKVIALLKNQRRLLMQGLGVFCLLLVALIAIPRLLAYKPKLSEDVSRPQAPNDAPAPVAIPQEDFFYPDEPDFLPKVLLEREPRARWTPQDASPFWNDPAGEDLGIWRDSIETVIDELLEGVP
ncbi:MAG: hypothetical protein LBD13_01395 [Spirochaetaceae bacterium]|jgi:hypothetical protein|nr:hypothetical protein [Spirochaetaceae bacterium]